MKSRGCRKLKRGNAGVPTNVYKISVARFTCCVVPPAVIAVVPLLYCTTNAFKVQRKCGLELFSLTCVQDGTPSNTHRSIVRSCHTTNTLKHGHCYSVAATASKTYSVIQAHSSTSSSRKQKQKSSSWFLML